ncbi:MAG: hypothetical protein KGL90_05415 [Burkholderiales bacterium]|nr:hypothetical protein [Burkholderiales bacterium]
MSSSINKWLTMLERLSERDRAALFAALLAVIIGLDMLVIMPLNAQRKSMLASMAATAQDSVQAQAAASKQRDELATGLAQRKASVDKDLAAFGLNNGLKDSLSFMLARTLRQQAVTIQGLRALTVEELTIAAPAAATAEAAPASDEPASAAPASLPPQLFRHRYELKLQTELASLPATLDALENSSRPLRVESVHLQAQPTGVIEATVMLVTIGLEKTWLAL